MKLEDARQSPKGDAGSLHGSPQGDPIPIIPKGSLMTQPQAELIDVDYYCELMDQSVVIEIIQDGELNIHLIKHPEQGVLTAIQGGTAVLLVQGSYIDRRERPFRLEAARCKSGAQ